MWSRELESTDIGIKVPSRLYAPDGPKSEKCHSVVLEMLSDRAIAELYLSQYSDLKVLPTISGVVLSVV